MVDILDKSLKITVLKMLNRLKEYVNHKGLMDTDSSVVIAVGRGEARGREGLKGDKWYWKNTIKINYLKKNMWKYKI